MRFGDEILPTTCSAAPGWSAAEEEMRFAPPPKTRKSPRAVRSAIRNRPGAAGGLAVSHASIDGE